MVPGTHGIRPARPGRPVDTRLAPQGGHAGEAQLDQGPGGLQAARARRDRGGGGRVVQDDRRPSPFMLFVHEVLPRRPPIPAVCHVDGTARIQTVSRAQNPLYYDAAPARFRPGRASRSWSTPPSTPAPVPSSARRGRPGMFLYVAPRRPRGPFLLTSAISGGAGSNERRKDGYQGFRHRAHLPQARSPGALPGRPLAARTFDRSATRCSSRTTA